MAGAEDLLRELGFGQCAFATTATSPGSRSRPTRSGARGDVREALARRLRALGFTYVTLDLQGFRSGSMNEASRADAADAGEAPRSPPRGEDTLGCYGAALRGAGYEKG